MDWLPSGIDFELFVKEYRLFLRKIKGDIEMYAKDRAANVEAKGCICYRQMNFRISLLTLPFLFLFASFQHFIKF